MFVAAADLSTDCGREQSAGLRRSGRYRQHAMVIRRGDKHCLSASGAEVAEPARSAPRSLFGARPAPRLAGPSRPTLGPSALAGRRLAVATAGWRKASDATSHVMYYTVPCLSQSHRERVLQLTSISARRPDVVAGAAVLVLRSANIFHPECMPPSQV